MSNKVWVTWKSSQGEDLSTQVVGLENNDNVCDLRRVFVELQRIDVGPGTLSVFKQGSTEKLRSSDTLQDYFVVDGSAPGPGRSEDTALVVTIPQQQQQEDGCTIKLKYKKSTFDWATSTSEGNMTLVALADVARRNFSIPVAKLEFIHNGISIHKDADVAALKNGSLVEVENKQVTFSSVKDIAQALLLVGRESRSLCEDSAAFPQPVILEESNDNVKHAIATISGLQSLVPIVGGCEATRRLYIDPILCAAGLNVGELSMTVEKTIEDAQFNGDVDYMFSFQNTIICVTEGKEDQLDYGIAQNIAQLSSVRANRKRKIGEISNPATFGIATTFIEWVFIKYEDERILRSKLFVVNPENPESITNIVGRITGLLQTCKSDAGGGQPQAIFS